MMMDKKGIEPLAIKLLAGMILLAVGLGIGIAMYRRAKVGIERELSFLIEISPTSFRLAKPQTENTLTSILTVQPIGDYSLRVDLTAEVSPGIKIIFSPSSGRPPFHSTVMIRIDNTAEKRIHTLTIKAIGEDGAVKSQPLLITLD